MTDETAGVRTNRWGGVAIAILFGLFFAYQLFGAISNAVEFPRYFADAATVPWWLLILGIAVPPLLYLGAYLLGRRSALFARALIFAAALAASYCLWLSIVTLAPVLLVVS